MFSPSCGSGVCVILEALDQPGVWKLWCLVGAMLRFLAHFGGCSRLCTSHGALEQNRSGQKSKESITTILHYSRPIVIVF